MEPFELISFLHLAEKLKCNTRHSFTSTGRPESVAEHSWRLALMALLLRGEFPELDCDRVVRMCLVHDLGEAVCGDIPSFEKGEADERREREAVTELLRTLPGPAGEELSALFAEMEEQRSGEARLFRALDKLEAVLQHNEAPLSTWLPLERELQQSYGRAEAEPFPYLRELQRAFARQAREKIESEEMRG